MTEQSDIEKAILQALYEGWFRDEAMVNLRDMRDEQAWDHLTYDKAVDTLIDKSLIRRWTAGGDYRIRSPGIIYAEDQGIAATPQIETCRNLRTQLLALLGDLYDKQGRYAYQHFQALATETGSDPHFVDNNLQVLQELGYVDTPANGSFSLTRRGLDTVEQQRQQNALVQELEKVSQLKPHPRGRALQKLFAKAVAQEGWSQAEGVRTSHEEMDVIVSQAREYYLVECKWEKKPIEADVVRELYGKLGNRVGVRGILLSMGGFTGGAAQQVEDFAGSKVILLFGPEDMRSMIHRQASFEQLLDEKYGALATRRKAIFK